ncbi:MAG: Gldg family protein [Clostridia bacterium]|nr:Gldg family protein [Clostridia bacterium]
MNNNIMDKQKEAVTRKLKYGSLSAGFAVMVVVLCIALNLAASLLSAKWDLRVDITDDEARYYTISEGTKKLFDTYFEDNPDWKITIRFLAPEDKVADTMVLELARSYASTFNGHIDLAFTDINSNVDKWEQYCEETQVELTQYHVLVEGEYHTRAISFANFYYTDVESNTTVAFAGEKTYTSAMVKAGLKESPLAVFTAGHGESLDNGKYLLADFKGLDPKQLAQANKLTLFDTLYDMGFDVQVVDLNESELPANTRLVFISDPQRDFMDYDPENKGIKSELEKIKEAMDSFNLTLMVSVDNKTVELPNLSRYLEVDFGLMYKSGVSVTDNDRSIKGSGGNKLLGSVAATKSGSLGAQIVQGFSSDERFVFADSVLLSTSTALDVQGEDVLMATSPAAVADGKTGVFPLIAYTMQANSIEDEEGNDTDNKEYKTAYLFGSTEFLASDYINTRYSNRALLESILRKANTVQEYVAIDEVYFVDEALEITTGDARAWTVIVTLLAPAVIFAVAAVVWLKRRHA